MKPIKLFLLMVCSSTSVLAQGSFVYTNNDGNPNSISAFSVAANGALTPVPGSPFPTGGNGLNCGFFASNRITTANVKDFVYAANAGSNNVSAFSVNLPRGSL
jgi:hypothetical protein